MENHVRERRRLEILRAATNEFSQNGFEGTRMEAVAKRAGIGKSTVYEYFPSKSELFRAVCELIIEDVLKRVQSSLCAALPVRDLLLRYFACILDLQQALGSAMPLVNSGEIVFQHIRSYVEQFCQETRYILTETLQAAAERGEISDSCDCNAAALVILSLSAPGFFENLQATETNLETVVDFVLRGCR